MNEQDKVKAIVYHAKASEVLWNGESIPTNREVMIRWSDALKLSRMFKVDILEVIKEGYDSSLWKEKKMFGFTGDADIKSGFGNCTTNLLRYSIANGYDIRWIGRAYEVPDLLRLQNKPIPRNLGMVWHEQPNDRWNQSPFKKNIAIVPFETTKIPQSWVDRINKFDALFCICRQNMDMMRDSGVTIPIELIHWGVDENLFYPLQREDKETFTFGTMGALSIRKGTDILVKAFTTAFPQREFPNVKLICKTSSNVFPFNDFKDKRVIVNMTAVDHQDLLQNFFKKIDCFVFPTRGEAWGMPLTEAMATGLPVITTGWSGPTEFMIPDVGWTLKYKLVPAKNFTEQVYKEDCGLWAEPDFDDLIDKMRYAYFHREEVKQKGLNAAKHIKDYFLWKDTIHYFHNALDRHL